MLFKVAVLEYEAVSWHYAALRIFMKRQELLPHNMLMNLMRNIKTL